jgi:hydrogenase maturation factor HypE
LLQQFVHQRGFAVVHVGDDGDIAEFFDHGAVGRAKTGRAL